MKVLNNRFSNKPLMALVKAELIFGTIKNAPKLMLEGNVKEGRRGGNCNWRRVLLHQLENSSHNVTVAKVTFLFRLEYAYLCELLFMCITYAIFNCFLVI